MWKVHRVLRNRDDLGDTSDQGIDPGSDDGVEVPWENSETDADGDHDQQRHAINDGHGIV
jgi:hypothetical protein